jgi:hypothetical protein
LIIGRLKSFFVILGEVKALVKQDSSLRSE